MDIGEYRRDYAAYRSASERERFGRHSGLDTQPDPKTFEERYADLWTREAVEDLRLRLDETPEQFETERAALRALKGAACLKFSEARALEVEAELRRCAESARFDWQGRRLSSTEAPELIAAEGDAARRREAAARWFEEVRRCDDLRAARLEALDEAAQALGFGGRLALHESIAGVSLEGLSPGAEGFLKRTAPIYISHLSRWAARVMPAAGARAAPHYADGLFFRRAAHLDDYFRGHDFRAVYGETVAGLGVRLEAQPNLRLDEEARPSKRLRSGCFAVAPPEDVRLVVGAARRGAAWQRESFHEGGRAQVFAWVSRDSAARYPEFVYPPDRATVEGHASLFSGLFRDAGWLDGHWRMRPTRAREAAGLLALVELHDARRECAALLHSLTTSGSKVAPSEQSAEQYAESHTEATGFRYEAATHLLDADAGITSSGALRARLFAAGLAEHLRARHGRRWHASRGAGDELRDIWNTGSRYAVEELARLVWGGELSFELLADELIAAVNESDV
jgi:hypothetical protein